MKRVAFFSVAVMLIMIAFLVGTAEATGQETCPDGGDWFKVDGLSGFTYTYTPPAGYTVTDNCYKHATYVHYGTGATVTADTHETCEWKWIKHREWWGWWWSYEYICTSHQYELSHASFKLAEIPYVPCTETITQDKVYYDWSDWVWDGTQYNRSRTWTQTTVDARNQQTVCGTDSGTETQSRQAGTCEQTKDPVFSDPVTVWDPTTGEWVTTVEWIVYDAVNEGVICDQGQEVDRERGEVCPYNPQLPVGHPDCKRTYCKPYNVGTWYECNTGNSTWSATSADKCWCQGLTGRRHYHTTYDCGNSYVTEGNWDEAPDTLGHYPGEVCPVGGC